MKESRREEEGRGEKRVEERGRGGEESRREKEEIGYRKRHKEVWL